MVKNPLLYSLLYGAETWRIMEKHKKKVEVLAMNVI